MSSSSRYFRSRLTLYFGLVWDDYDSDVMSRCLFRTNRDSCATNTYKHISAWNSLEEWNADSDPIPPSISYFFYYACFSVPIIQLICHWAFKIFPLRFAHDKKKNFSLAVITSYKVLFYFSNFPLTKYDKVSFVQAKKMLTAILPICSAWLRGWKEMITVEKFLPLLSSMKDSIFRHRITHSYL